MKKKKNTINKFCKLIMDFKWELIVFLGVGGIINAIFLSQGAFKGKEIVAENAGQYGSFIGGCIGTMFNLLSAVLLFSTLKMQRESSEIEKFENKFFELLRLHRENVNEIGMGHTKGRATFVILLRNFREIFGLTVAVCNEYLKENQIELNIKSRINIAYLSFYYGTGSNSRRILKEALSDNYPPLLIEKLIERFDEEYEKKKGRCQFRLFEGHQSRLGHYYRHLFQTVKYVHNKNIDIDKHEYIKTLRAQLSNHEQALLVFNALSDIGKEWNKRNNNDKNLIEEYELIKNIPKEFIDSKSEIDLKELFPKLKFEWEKPDELM